MNENEMIARGPSVGADGGRPLKSNVDHSLADKCISDKEKKELQERIKRDLGDRYLKTFSVNDLLDREFDLQLPIVEGILYPGIYMLGGASKLGKSFLALQIAYHVSTGRELWGHRTNQSGVLYLALEDSQRRLQRRLSTMFGTEGTDDLRFATASRKIGGGLELQLQHHLECWPDTRLIIIDVLQKIRKSDGDGYSYANDYETIGALKQLTDTRDVCLIIVHHTRKQDADDIFDTISGTTGLMGCADGAMVLHKENRTSLKAALDITGRDQPDQTLHLIRDPVHLTWQFERAETEPWEQRREPFLDSIEAVLSGGIERWEGRASDLAALLEEEIQPNQLIRKLNVGKEKLAELYGIEYTCKRSGNGCNVRLERMKR